MRPMIDKANDNIRRWSHEMYNLWGDKALMKLALIELKRMKIKRAIGLLYAGIRGELDAATVAEALAILQWRWYKTKDDMMISIRVWTEVFR